MTALSVKIPVPIFYGNDGRPLSGGYVYVGQANQDPRSYPASVYYDEALTIPAPQPLRTSAGYLYRNGTPTRVWVGSAFSLLVLDSDGRQISYAGDAASGTGGAFLQGGTGAVLRSMQDKARDFVGVKDFGAVGDWNIAAGTGTDDTAAIRAAHDYALSIGAALFFPGNASGYAYKIVGWTDTSSLPVNWFGAGNSTIYVSTSSIMTFASPSVSLTLSGNNLRDQAVVNVSSAAGVSANDIIYLQSDVVAETSFSIGVRQTAMALSIVGTAITLDYPLTFDFNSGDAGLTAVAYTAPREVNMRKLNWVSTIAGRPFDLIGCFGGELADISGTTTYVGSPNTSSDGPALQRCIGVKVRNHRTSKYRYAINFGDGSRDCMNIDPFAQSVRHQTYFNGWSHECKVLNPRGQNCLALADSHAAYCITYEGVGSVTEPSDGVSNNRAGGAILRNSRMRTTANGSAGLLVSSLLWNALYADRKAKWDVIVENVQVDFLGTAPTFGINAGYARNLILDGFYTNTSLPASLSPLLGSTRIILGSKGSNIDFNQATTTSIVRAPIKAFAANDTALGIADAVLNLAARTSLADPTPVTKYEINPYPVGVMGTSVKCSGAVTAESATANTVSRAIPIRLFYYPNPLNLAGSGGAIDIFLDFFMSARGSAIGAGKFYAQGTATAAGGGSGTMVIVGTAQKSGAATIDLTIGAVTWGTNSSGTRMPYIDFTVTLTSSAASAYCLDYDLRIISRP